MQPGSQQINAIFGTHRTKQHATPAKQNSRVHMPLSQLHTDGGNGQPQSEILQTSSASSESVKHQEIPPTAKKPRKNAVIHTERTDELIRRAYTSPDFGKSPMLKRLVTITGIKQSSIHRRAVELGVVRQTYTQKLWTDAEIDIITKNAHKTLSAINEALIRGGFKSRSLEAIRAKLSKLDLQRRQSRSEAGIYSLNETGRLMGVHANTVKRWIDSGMLSVNKRDDCTATEYLISASQIRRLIIEYTPAIHVSRIDKYWLVDLLTGKIVEQK